MINFMELADFLNIFSNAYYKLNDTMNESCKTQNSIELNVNLNSVKVNLEI